MRDELRIERKKHLQLGYVSNQLLVLGKLLGAAPDLQLPLGQLLVQEVCGTYVECQVGMA